MSLDSLTEDERASFMLGQALRHAMLNEARDKETVDLGTKAWAVYSGLCDHVLSKDEAIQIRRTTSLIDLSDQWEEGYEPRWKEEDLGL